MQCEKCDLSKTRKNIVMGHGNRCANIVFIGEAPGRLEDIQGKPFVGTAGRILDNILKSMKLNREDVFITNIVKCRPPDNRNPTEEEISACSPYLDKELDVIKPKVIIPMGTFATRYILEKNGIEFKSMFKHHGVMFRVRDTIVYPLYHPASLIYNKELGETMLLDAKRLDALWEQEIIHKVVKKFEEETES